MQVGWEKQLPNEEGGLRPPPSVILGIFVYETGSGISRAA